MTAVIDSGEEIVSLSQRLLGRVPCEDIVDPGNNEVIAKKGKIIEEYQIPLLDAANLVSVKLRSVLTCETKRGACATCYGRDLARGTPVNIGEAVGVIAAQSIGEPGTQLTMINVVDENGTERASHKLPYGSQLMVKDGDSIKKNQRLAQWDPYTIPIITETAGTVGFEDLVDGISIGEVSDESTGISQKVVIDWKNSAKSADFKPSMVIKGDNGEIVSLENNREARYLMSVDAIISSSDGTKVGAGDVIARIPTEGAKTKDIN